jgi:WD40 repeat protein/tRNA A-37 threonylcarbamoyl transferase component Bud32
MSTDSPEHDDLTPTRLLRSADTKQKQRLHELPPPSVRGYEVLAVIGSGGMGIVYKARHRELRRTVALKTIRATALAHPESLQRFHAEAEAVARLQHPNIIQVFEIGTVDPQPGEILPSPFIALEFVDGGSLAHRAAEPQTPQYAARMVEKLARAAHAAHRLGVIHRDLKPANVLLTPDGEPKIADFGLAKQLRAERDSAGRFVTQSGLAMGTPEYMAPEQSSGTTPTPAVDIYALGVILYELLTARVPFQGATTMETVDLLLRQEPVSPRRLQPNLPCDLETVCLKCLEKVPEKRYESAEALADDLRRFLDGRPIHARPVGPLERVVRWARRNPLPAALTVAVVLVALVGLAGMLWKWREAEEHAVAAETATSEARDHARAERWERYRANIIAGASSLQVYNVTSARRTLEAAPSEHRNWEWRHFHSRLDLAQHVLRVFEGKAGDGRISRDGRRVLMVSGKTIRVWDTVDQRQILSLELPDGFAHVQLSPDGRTLAYRKSDLEVELRDIDSNQVRAVLGGHDKIVDYVNFIQNGERLITGSGGQAPHIWDARTGEFIRLIPTENGRNVGVCFSPDGQRMTTWVSGDATITVWDVPTGRRLATLPGKNRSLERVSFNLRGDRILTAETFPSNLMHLWETDTGRLLGVLRGHTNSVSHAVFSPDGRRIVSGSRDQSGCLWDAADGRLIARLQGHRGRVTCVSFSPDGKRLLSSAEDQTLRLWDATSGEALAVLHGHTDIVLEAAYTADGSTIVSLSQDGTVRTWDAWAAENDGILRGHTSFVYGVAFHPDSERVASVSWDGTVRIWDATTGRQKAVLHHGERMIVSSVAFHPDGKILATRARDAVRLWDVASGQEIHCWNVPNDGWHDTRLTFNRRGDRLAAGCKGNVIRIWDMNSRAETAVLQGHRDGIRDVAFSPDGRLLASVADDADSMVRIWDVARGEQIHALEGHRGSGYVVAWNDDGTLLASAATDGTVRLWNTSSWKAVAVLRHGTKVYGVAFTPDGTRLACACADNSIRFWDVGTRQEVAELRGHGNYVHQIAFSPDGTRLVSASGDQTVRIWDTLSPQERQKNRKADAVPAR